MSDALAQDVLATTALVGLAGWALHRPDAPLQWRELRFPREFAVAQVEAMLTQVGAGGGPVLLVIEARLSSIRFLIGAGKTTLAGVSAGLAGVAPEVRLDEPSARSPFRPSLGVRAWWPGQWPLLRTDATELATAGLLGSLATVRADEALRLVIRLRPLRRRPRLDVDSLRPPAARHVQSQLQRKLAGPLLQAEVLLGVTAQPAPRARQLAQAIIAALRAVNGPRGRMRVRRLSAAAAARALARASGSRGWWLVPKTLLSPAELVPIVAWPVAAPRVAGIAYGTAPRLMPQLDLPNGPASKVRVFAQSTWPGALDRPLAQPVIGGLQHAAVIGPTGSGKSALIGRLVEQDMASGRGALVVDVKGDLVDELLARVPEQRERDVIVIDPAGDGPQPGLNLFPAGGDHELTADLLLGTLSEIYRDSWGIRTSSYLHLGLRTLSQARGASLPLLPALFTDRRLRAQMLRGVSDPLLLAAWQRFEALTSADQATQLAPALRKIDELTARARLRVVLGQAHPRLHFGEVLARGRIVLVRLPPGLLGAPATRLLAACVLWQFAQAVEARAALPAHKRHPFMAYVDEIAALGSLPLGIEGLLERARSHGVGLTLAPQSLTQLAPALRASLLANVGSLVAFRVNADEAKTLARELPGVSAEQLQHLDRFEVALRLSLGPGHVTSTMTGRTLPMGEACSDPDALRRLSGERWGQTLEDVDRALGERLGVTPLPQTTVEDHSDHDAAGSVGSRRRAS